MSTQKQRGRPVDRHSSISKARAIYASLPSNANSRKESVKAFMEIKNFDGVPLTKDTAGAYYAVIMRGLKHV